MTRWLYLSVSLQMLPDCHSLLDKVVEILGQVRGQTLGLEDPQNLVAGDKTHLGHTVGVPQNHTWNTATNKLETLTVCLFLSGLNLIIYLHVN